MTHESDIVIVGAGLAGLSAAHRLHANGVDVTVLEAADQVGGRTRSEVVDGSTIDFGAEWLGPRHTHLQALIRELNLTTEPARMFGRPIRWRGATRERVGRSLPVRDEIAAARLLWRLRRLAHDVDAHHPWDSPRAAERDRTTFGDWLRSNGARGDLYRYIAGVVGMLTGTQVDQLSLLQVLWWCARAGGPIAMIRTTFAARVTGGTQSIANALAAELNERVRTSCTATRIAQDDRGVTVHTDTGDAYRSRRVIVTGSLDSAAPISFDPDLHTDLDELRIPPSIKVTATLPHRHQPRHVLTLGGKPLGAAWRNGARITGFVLPGEDKVTDDDLIADLASCYDIHPEQLRFPRVFCWSEHPAVGGCDIGFRPGQITTLGPYLAIGHGRIDVAGAERSSWPNNMEGAVESGHRAAVAVTDALVTQ